MSINWSKSAELNNCDVDWLKAWFNKYPGSGKRIIVNCDICGRERNVIFKAYTCLCNSCGLKKAHVDDPTLALRKSAATSKRYEDPEEREKQSILMTKRYEDPKEREKQSIAGKKRYEDPEEREKQRIIQEKICARPGESERRSIQGLKAIKDDPTLTKRRGLGVHKKYIDNPFLHEQRFIKDPTLKKRMGKTIHLAYVNDPSLREKTSISQLKRFEDPKEREKLSATNQGIPYEEWTNYTDKGRPHLTPCNACIHLNPKFKGCNQHHIMSGVVINIPADLHRSIWHKFPNDNEGKNMKEINELAFKYLMEGI